MPTLWKRSARRTNFAHRSAHRGDCGWCVAGRLYRLGHFSRSNDQRVGARTGNGCHADGTGATRPSDLRRRIAGSTDTHANAHGNADTDHHTIAHAKRRAPCADTYSHPACRAIGTVLSRSIARTVKRDRLFGRECKYRFGMAIGCAKRFARKRVVRNQSQLYRARWDTGRAQKLF